MSRRKTPKISTQLTRRKGKKGPYRSIPRGSTDLDMLLRKTYYEEKKELTNCKLRRIERIPKFYSSSEKVIERLIR